jgi:hypothetical protein
LVIRLVYSMDGRTSRNLRITIHPKAVAQDFAIFNFMDYQNLGSLFRDQEVWGPLWGALMHFRSFQLVLRSRTDFFGFALPCTRTRQFG